MPNNHSNYRTRDVRSRHGSPVQHTRGHGGPGVETTQSLLGEALYLDHFGGQKSLYGLLRGIGGDAVEPYEPFRRLQPVRERRSSRGGHDIEDVETTGQRRVEVGPDPCGVAVIGESDLEVFGLAGPPRRRRTRGRDLPVRRESGTERHRDPGAPHGAFHGPGYVAMAGEPQPSALR